jgi:hypothetical protein
LIKNYEAGYTMHINNIYKFNYMGERGGGREQKMRQIDYSKVPKVERIYFFDPATGSTENKEDPENDLLWLHENTVGKTIPIIDNEETVGRGSIGFLNFGKMEKDGSNLAILDALEKGVIDNGGYRTNKSVEEAAERASLTKKAIERIKGKVDVDVENIIQFPNSEKGVRERRNSKEYKEIMQHLNKMGFSTVSISETENGFEVKGAINGETETYEGKGWTAEEIEQSILDNRRIKNKGRAKKK